ncbi:hypothetical protein pipiens_009838 [Culex pipiens pipiens]|uniref:Uncharacterized protein n=1 Tax=Culex pipiens pipiens TaxID=38569 RepID=A0ABD1DCQ6_CULPP
MLGSTVPTLFGFTTLDSSKYRVLSRSKPTAARTSPRTWTAPFRSSKRTRTGKYELDVVKVVLTFWPRLYRNPVNSSSDLEESKNRETESPMTVEYNSDCELNEGDTLCIEDSVEGQESKTGEDPK